MVAFIYLLLYVLIVASPLILILLRGPTTDHGMIYEIGKAFALMGFMMIGMQFILSSRRKWIERPFGLDMVFSYHKAMAVLAGVLILAHPVLLSIGLDDFGLLTSLSLPWYIWLGKVGVLLIILQIVISLFRIKFHLKFEKWRFLHNIAGGTLLAGAFVHSLVTSHADLHLASLQVLWWVFLFVGLAFYVHHKFIVPAVLKKNAYTVSGIRQAVHNVWTLELAPPESKKLFSYLPGQFQFIKLHRGRGLPEEEHHFTISSSPTQPGTVTSSIKESGDFTSTIRKTQQGDTVSVEAPFGRFSHVLYPQDKNFVFIAGGIGITPLMSMLRHMRGKNSPFKVLLFYGNHTEDDIVFREELDTIAASESPQLKVVHVLDHPNGTWNGETGFVDQALLKKYIDNFKDKAYYVCCPPAMRKSILKILKNNNVKNNQIRVEIFSL